MFFMVLNKGQGKSESLALLTVLAVDYYHFPNFVGRGCCEG